MFFRNERGALSPNLVDGVMLRATISESLVSHPQYTTAIAAAEGTAFVCVFYKLIPIALTRSLAVTTPSPYPYSVPMLPLPPPPQMALSLVMPAMNSVGQRVTFSSPVLRSQRLPTTPIATTGPLTAAIAPITVLEQPMPQIAEFCRKDEDFYDASLLELLENINEKTQHVTVTAGPLVTASSASVSGNIEAVQKTSTEVATELHAVDTLDALECLFGAQANQSLLDKGKGKCAPQTVKPELVKENFENVSVCSTINSVSTEDFRIFKFIEDQMNPSSSRRKRSSQKTTEAKLDDDCTGIESESRGENSNFSQSLGTQDTEETSREKSDDDDLGVNSDSNSLIMQSQSKKRTKTTSQLQAMSSNVDGGCFDTTRKVVEKKGVLTVKKRITPTFVAPLEDRLNFLSTSSAFSLTA